MALSEVHCLIGQAACGRVAGNPVCPKCGMDERVVYPGQADLEAALTEARKRYLESSASQDWADMTLEELQSFALQGNRDAQNSLGWRLIGQGDDPDSLMQGETWLHRWANSDHNPPPEYLAHLHEQVAFGYQHSKVSQHLTHASRWHVLASEHGSALSSFTLGLMYAEGWGVDCDASKATGFFEKGAKLDSHDGSGLKFALYGFHDGASFWVYECRHIPSRTSLACLLVAGRAGHTEAQCLLGQVFAEGVPLPEAPLPEVSSKEVQEQWAGKLNRSPDPAESAFWFRKAAVAGHKVAMWKLAQSLLDGAKTAGNPAEAIEWATRSASAGHVDAMLGLAEMALSKRIGLPEAAVTRWLDAAIGTDPGVSERVARRVEELKPTEFSESFAWWLKGANLGQKKCMLKVASRLYTGQGTTKDPGTADQWLEKMLGAPSGKGDTYWANDAVDLAEEFVKGGKLPVDEARGVALLRRAAELEAEPMSYLWLGLAYATGCGVDINPASAERWWQEALRLPTRWVRTEIAEALLHLYRVVWAQEQHYEEARQAFRRGVGKTWRLDDVGLSWLQLRTGAKEQAGFTAFSDLYWGQVIAAENTLLSDSVGAKDRRDFALGCYSDAQRTILDMRKKGWFVGLAEIERMKERMSEIESMRSPGVLSRLFGRHKG